MKLDWSTVINVLIALVIFSILNKLFLDAALDKAFSHFEEE